MKTAIRKVGNSHAVIIPKRLLAEIGASVNDAVDLTVSNGQLVITPTKNPAPRAGWAEASKRLREAGDGGLM